MFHNNFVKGQAFKIPKSAFPEMTLSFRGVNLYRRQKAKHCLEMDFYCSKLSQEMFLAFTNEYTSTSEAKYHFAKLLLRDSLARTTTLCINRH